MISFSGHQANPLYCGLSRGLFESTVLASLSHVSVLCSRFAVDMMMFTQQETAFFSLSDAFVTGSSIMPQKKNYDVFEIMRAQGKVYASYASQVQNIIQTLGSGYHRDLQLTKKALIRAFDVLLECLSVLELAVPAIAVHTEKLEVLRSELCCAATCAASHHTNMLRAGFAAARTHGDGNAGRDGRGTLRHREGPVTRPASSQTRGGCRSGIVWLALRNL